MKVLRNENNKKKLVERYLSVANKVAKAFSSLENVEAIVIGGSVARNFFDDHSDIEMYVYYNDKMPSRQDVSNIILKLNAKLNRSKKIFWFYKAWGYHTFFVVDGINIELGYREVKETENRINVFLSKFLLPQHGIHDTPFGHYESGVANCILACVPLYKKNTWIDDIKEVLAHIPADLKKTTLKYYYRDAKVITNIKMKTAVKRNDTFLFHACLARVVRSLNICLFTLNGVYYPGDKWNHKYISEFINIPNNYVDNMNKILNSGCLSCEDKKIIYRILMEVIRDTNLLIKYD